MAQKFIPREKLSKKAKRALDERKRKVWEINPVSRKGKNPRAYDRKGSQHRPDDGGGSLFCGNI